MRNDTERAIPESGPGKVGCPKNRALLLSAMVVASALAAPFSQAQEGVSEDYFFADVPIVLSVTRLQQPLTATPASVSVIDRKMIRASGATSIPDLLRHVPGFQVAYVTGKRAAVTAHGRGDEYARDMQVTIDGRSIYDPVFGGVSWQDLQLDIDSIQRIEVVRGPNAASHGSNSFAGVINIITEHPAAQPGLLAKTLVGEGGERSLYGRYAGSAGGLDYRIAVGHNESDGFDSREDDESTDWISLRGDLQADPRNTLMLQLGYSNGPREEGFYDDVLQPVRNVDHINHYQQLRWNRLLSTDEELQLQLYHNFQRKDDHFQVELPVLVEGGFGFDSHRYDLELQYSNRIDSGLRLAAGVGARYESAEGFWTFAGERHTRRQYRLFANIEWELERGTIFNLGGMYEAYQGKRGLFSPRFALNHRLNDNNTLRFVASRAYRMPTLWEDHANLIAYLASNKMPLDYVFRSIEDLEAEEITSFEIGYLGNFPQLGMQLDARIFKERISEIIANITDDNILGPLNLDPGAQSYANNGKVYITGLELELNYRPVSRALIHMGYSLTNVYGEQLRHIYDDGTRRYLDLDSSVPQQTFSLLGSYRFGGGFEISSAYHYVDPMEWLYDGDYIPVQKRWDLRIAKSIRQANSALDLELLFQNIDGEDIDFYNSPDRNQINLSDRRLMFRATLRFH